MKKIKIGIIALLIFIICFSFYYKYNEGKNINKFFNDFLNNENYINYFASVNIESSGKLTFYTTEDKRFIYDLLHYLTSSNTKKYNHRPKPNTIELEKSRTFYSITILAKNSENISNTIIIDMYDYNVFDVLNNYNKEYNNKCYYLNKDFDTTITELIEKYNIQEYDI